MSQYLKDLHVAFNNVHKNYLNDDVIHSLRKNGVSTQKIERVFHAELYHQWRKIMDDDIAKTDGSEKIYSDYVLHSQIGKNLGGNVKFPDLVLHGGQIGQYRNTKNEIFAEIKIEDFDSSDFLKIIQALLIPEFKYNYGVYILSLSDFGNIKKCVNGIVQDKTRYPHIHRILQDKKQLFERFFFITYADGLFDIQKCFK